MRVALIGCGPWGANVLRDLNSLGAFVDVVARSKASKARATRGKAASIVPRVENLPAVQGYVIATSSSSHAEVLESVFRHDSRAIVFVEKPMTSDARSAARLAKKHSGRLFVMHKWRYHPGIEELGRMGREGALGRVEGLQLFREGWGTHHPDVSQLWTLLPHDLSIVTEILGSIPDPKSAAVESVNGEPVGLEASLGDFPRVRISSTSTSPRTFRRVVLHGREGRAILPDSYSSVVEVVRFRDFAKKEPKIELRRVSTELPLLRELRAFVQHLDGGPPPKSDAAEGANVVKCIEKLERLAGVRRRHGP